MLENVKERKLKWAGSRDIKKKSFKLGSFAK
jgi:hypothetical protein